jgi:hypothetical protein
MSFKFNPFTGNLDLVGAASGATSFDPDIILTGPTECLYSVETTPQEVLIDESGNVLTEA